MKKNGFTLIELLIVVAIIAILAAIAVPNFLEAQTRSKVSRVKADLRTIATALEAYNTDYNNYPYWAALGIKGPLTTPIAYLTSDVSRDLFNDKGTVHWMSGGIWDTKDYQYVPYSGDWGKTVAEQTYHRTSLGMRGCALVCIGPDHIAQSGEVIGLPNDGYPAAWGPKVKYYYDPTNGTVSVGEILRFQGEHNAPTVN